MRKLYTFPRLLVINFLFLRNLLLSRKLHILYCYPLEIFAVAGGWITLRVKAKGCHLISVGNHFHVPGNVSLIHFRLSEHSTLLKVVFHGVNHSEEYSVAYTLHHIRKDYNALAALQQANLCQDKWLAAPLNELSPLHFTFGNGIQNLHLNPQFHRKQVLKTSPKLFFQPIRIYKWKKISIPPPSQIS